MLLLESTGVKIAGKHAVVLGRSDIVGSPVCALLRRKDATVTQCHSRTQNLEAIVGPVPTSIFLPFFKPFLLLSFVRS